MVSCLRASGHTVVRYDFLGHGWSVASELWLQQDSKVLLSQLQDVLVHVLNNKTASKTAAGQVESLKTVETFVGHSTGGQKKKRGGKKSSKTVETFVAHSTGGLVGILATHPHTHTHTHTQTDTHTPTHTHTHTHTHAHTHTHTPPPPGGLVGILACDWLRDRFPIRNLVLVAPALWKQAPPIVQLSDRIPDTMYASVGLF